MDTDSQGSSLAEGSSSLYSFLPPTYRPIALFCIGLWGWALNLYILQRCQMDTAALLSISHADKTKKLYRPLFSIAMVLTFIVTTNLWFFWKYVLTYAESAANVTRSWLPLMCYITCLLVISWPGKIFYYSERHRFMK